MKATALSILTFATLALASVTADAAGPANSRVETVMDRMITRVLSARLIDVRIDAARTLGELGGPRAVTALEHAAANDRNAYVRLAARRALQRIADRALAARLVQHRPRPRPLPRRAPCPPPMPSRPPRPPAPRPVVHKPSCSVAVHGGVVIRQPHWSIRVSF